MPLFSETLKILFETYCGKEIKAVTQAHEHPYKGIEKNNKTLFVEYIFVLVRKSFSWNNKKKVLLLGEKNIVKIFIWDNKTILLILQ